MTTEAPTDQRGDQRGAQRQRIVEQAAALLAEQGGAAVTTRRVAELAEVQAPTLYRLFGDKDGLLDAVAEHVMSQYVAAKADALQDPAAAETDPVEVLRAGWHRQIEFGLANPALYALLSDPARGTDSPATRLGLQLLEGLVHRVAVQGRLRVGEARAVELIRAAGTGAVLVTLGLPAERRTTDLADDLFETVCRSIITETPAAASGTVPLAVALRAVSPDLDALSPGERDLLGEWLDRVIDHTVS